MYTIVTHLLLIIFFKVKINLILLKYLNIYHSILFIIFYITNYFYKLKNIIKKIHINFVYILQLHNARTMF